MSRPRGGAPQEHVGARCRLLAALAFTGALVAGRASAVTFTVDDATDAVDASPGDSTCATAAGGCTVRAAVMETNALAGLDRIVLPAGIHELTIAGAGEDAAATGDLDVLGDLEIVGAGMDVTVLRGSPGLGDRLVHAVTQDQSLTVEGMTLALGTQRAGIGGGGAICVVDGNLTLQSAAFRNNEALYGGGVSVRGTLTADMVEFTDNVAGGNGGLSVGGSVLLTNALIARNSAENVGGIGAATYASDVSIDIADSVIRDNRATFEVGGLAVIAGTGRLSNLLVEGNVAGLAVGGASLEGLTELTLEDSIVARNSVTDPTDGGTGGLWIVDGVRLLRCLVTENVAAYGGGLSVGGDALPLESCAIVRNRGLVEGGGLSVLGEFSSADIINTTVSGNEAPVAGGVFIVNGARADFFNCTITDNQASGGDGGGLFVLASRSRLAHVILAGNTASTGTHDCAIDVDSDVTSLGFNLIGDPLGCIVTGDVASNVVGVDPMLGPLADNGGPTPTHELLLGSPALDGGDPAGCVDGLGAPIALDQRGWMRPVDGDEDGTILCDIGALEHAPIPPPFAGLAIQRSVSLSGSGASPFVETVFAAGCRQAYWQLCPEAVETRALDGMRLVGEGSTTALHSVWFYEHSDATQTMKVQREGDDLVFRDP